MSGGTEGIFSPHLTVISRSPGIRGNQADGGSIKSLVVGAAKTRSFSPEEIGRAAQVDEVAATVNRAIQEAVIANLSDVHFVQIKCPLLTADQIHSAGDRGANVVTDDTTSLWAIRAVRPLSA
jgi:cyanuric acid amidohydrolase